MKITKSEIRTLVKEKLRELSSEEKERESQKVSRKLIDLLGNIEFKTLVSYAPFDDEIDISSVSNWAKENGKEILMMRQDSSLEEVIIPKKSVIIVPGRAFTKDGKRVGRGGGFYDKLISENSHAKTIGVCFSCQIFPDLPQDNWDRRVSQVVFTGNTLE